MQNSKILQEFYCGECQTYIRIPLKMNWDRTVHINCPMCDHQHRRYIKDGIIYESGRYDNGDPKEDIQPLKSACSKEPITEAMKKAHAENLWLGRRDGVKIEECEYDQWENVRNQMTADLWADKAWREQNGD